MPAFKFSIFLAVMESKYAKESNLKFKYILLYNRVGRFFTFDCSKVGNNILCEN